MSTSIFDSLLLLSQTENTLSKPLICCMQVIGCQLKVAFSLEFIDKISLNTLKDYEKILGFNLYPLAIHSVKNLPASGYPILLEEKASGQLFVLLRKNCRNAIVYNPLHKKNASLSLNSLGAVNRAWQCIPQALPATSSYFSLLQFTLRFFKGRLVTAGLQGMLVSAATLIISILAGIILTHLLEMTQRHFFSFFAAIFLFSTGTAGFFYANGLFVKALNADILFLIIPNVIKHIVDLPIQVTAKFLSSDLSQRLSDYEAAIANIIKTSLAFFFNCIGLCVLLTYMAYCSTKLALLYFAICLICFASKAGLLPKNMHNLNHRLSKHSQLNAFLVETLLQIPKIRSANAENTVFNHWFHKLIQTKIFAETAIKIEIALLTLDAAFPLLLLLCFYSILYFSPNGLPSYDLIQLMISAGQFSMVFQKLSLELITLAQLTPGLKRLEPLLSEKSEHHNVSTATITFKNHLSLSHIYFRNNENGNCILEDVSLTIPAGKFVALIGQSGAGKSTVFRLLLGLESASSGAILIDNESVAHFNIKDIRKQFGVVLQTTNLFPGSIFSNISANSNITIDEAWRLAATVGLDQDINAMPMKMFTYISDNASESLSGGQKQKILIARALATQPTILLLDEATSALDSMSQALIHKNLSLLNITRVVIAHRYSTITNADIIYVMEKGKIIDCGSFHELKQRQSLPEAMEQRPY